MREGDIIEVLQEDDSGWWRGLLDGEEGVFPSNFTEPYDPDAVDDLGVEPEPEPSEEPEPEPEPEPEREDVPTQQRSAAPVNLMKGINMNELQGAMKARAQPKSAAAGPRAGAAAAAAASSKSKEPRKELVIARHDYQGATEDDELSFCGDDVITVIKKDNSGWWQGELRDEVGWFPSTFVRPLTREEELALHGADDEEAPAPQEEGGGADEEEAAAAARQPVKAKGPKKVAGKGVSGPVKRFGFKKAAAGDTGAAAAVAAPGPVAVKRGPGSSGNLASSAAAPAAAAASASSSAAAAASSLPDGWGAGWKSPEQLAVDLAAAASRSKGRNDTGQLEGRRLESGGAAVVWNGKVVAQCGHAGHVSLQEAALVVAGNSDWGKAAQNLSKADPQLELLLGRHPSLSISHSAVRALRASCAEAYSAASSSGASDLGAALESILQLRALGGSLAAIALELASQGDRSVTASNGLCVWVRGKLAVAVVDPVVGKDGKSSSFADCEKMVPL